MQNAIYETFFYPQAKNLIQNIHEMRIEKKNYKLKSVKTKKKTLLQIEEDISMECENNSLFDFFFLFSTLRFIDRKTSFPMNAFQIKPW